MAWLRKIARILYRTFLVTAAILALTLGLIFVRNRTAGPQTAQLLDQLGGGPDAATVTEVPASPVVLDPNEVARLAEEERLRQAADEQKKLEEFEAAKEAEKQRFSAAQAAVQARTEAEIRAEAEAKAAAETVVKEKARAELDAQYTPRFQLLDAQILAVKQKFFFDAAAVRNDANLADDEKQKRLDELTATSNWSLFTLQVERDELQEEYLSRLAAL